MLGIFEMGRAFTVKKAMSAAVRQGCRTGLLPNKSSDDVIADVRQVLTNAGIDPGQATITIQVNGVTADAKTAKPGDQVSVQVSIPFSAVNWVTPLFLQGRSVDSETLIMVRQA